ncbi:MAG: amidase [Deltaproteobacteria bacterium]|nr:amidase [Deltaproteobacteria bacterium]MBW2052492.1 amidase [Deltaproteobacteria bacterium]MBW2142314.1 amidase [Deltaproteobacteria bacterium]MBW2324413.1 amidase [Deltaproteobacteria bacterium]
MTGRSDFEAICFTPATELARMIREKEISPVEVVEIFLKRIEEVNPKVNAFCLVTSESAAQEAKQAEQAVMNGEALGPLHGVPFSIKDLVFTKSVKTMRGSRIYENFVPDEDAPLVTRLKGAGGIMVGKTTTPEFGHKGVTDSFVTGVTRNPWNLDLTPGGSSGGAGAQVAAGMTPLAVGTDGGGSVRIPSSFSGIYGLKPSYGRVPVYPVSQLDSLSHAGPMTRTVADAALMMSVMAGPDDSDPLSLEAPPADYAGELDKGIKGLRVAWSPDLEHFTTDDQVAEITAGAAKAFEELGVSVEEVKPGFQDISRAFGVFWLAGMAGMLEDYLEEWEDRIDPVLVEQVKLGLQMRAVDFVKAQMVRSEFRDRVRRFFQRYDLLLLPTLPILPFKAGVPFEEALKGQPVDFRNWSPFTAPFNLGQNPAATVPAGFSREGLPVGLQIVGRRFADLTVLQASAAFEAIRPWADKRPGI